MSPIQLLGVSCNSGLSSIIAAQCKGCWKKITFNTSPMLHHEQGSHYEVNLRAVWGQCVSGGGPAKLNEQLNTLAMPGMSGKTFSVIEGKIGDWWEQCLKQDMIAAGQEERKIALEKGNIDEGVPYISVICDGGWSKRSHKHTYNAPAGAAIIIGAETGKILHLGIRQKTCYI